MNYLIPTYPILNSDDLRGHRILLGHPPAEGQRSDQLRLGPFAYRHQAFAAFNRELAVRFCNAAPDFEIQETGHFDCPAYTAVGTPILVARPYTQGVAQSLSEEIISEVNLHCMMAKSLVVQTQVRYAVSRVKCNLKVTGCSYAALTFVSLISGLVPNAFGLPTDFQWPALGLAVTVGTWSWLKSMSAFSQPVDTSAERFVVVRAIEHSELYAKALRFVRGERNEETVFP